MARTRAQHADAGRYHLETWYDEYSNEWGWRARAKTPSNPPLAEFAGMTDSLEKAKQSATTSIGLVTEPKWEEIGPVIIVSD